jgi:hypothetical protein
VLRRSRAHETSARDLELVLVEIEGRAVLTTQPLLGYPVGQVLRSARVTVLRALFGKLDAHEVVGVTRIQALALRVIDNVIGRADQV